MFEIDLDPVFTWPVAVDVPTAGGFVRKQFRARFRTAKAEARERLGNSADGTRELMHLVVVELLDLADARGEPLPHSKELLDACLDLPWMVRGLLRAWAEALAGVPSEAAAGN